MSTTGPVEGPFDNPEDIEDDLAIFGGQMKLLSRKGKLNAHRRSPSTSGSVTTGSSVSSPQSQSSSSANASPTLGHQAAAVLGHGLELPDVHPSLITYLNQDAVRRAMAQGTQQQEQQREVAVPSGVNARRSEAPRPTTNISPRSGGGSVPGVVALLQGNANGQQRLENVDAGGPVQSHMDTYPDSRTSFDDAQRRPTEQTANSFPQLQLPHQYGSGVGPSRTWSMLNSFVTTDSPVLSRSGLSAYPDNSVDSGGMERVTSSGPAGGGGDGLSFSASLGSALNAYTGENVYSSAANANMGHSYTQPYFQRLGSYGLLSGQSMGSYSAGQDSDRRMQTGIDLVSGNSTYAIPTAGWTGDGANLADVVEMGLSSESGMDAGWMSFMRDCGIMDTEG